MLQNNLDPEVAEHPDDLVVYGGTGKAARDWDSFDAIVRTLPTLKSDETLLVQSGKPVGVLQTHEWAPRVLIANSNLVGDWANWDEFRRLEQLGLTMYGQMTAGSWIYIGTQGILQGTYETFAAVAAKRFGGTLAGTITLTAGLGGMGGAQPLAVTMNDGVAICVEVDPSRIARRIEHGYLDVEATSIDDALELAYAARDAEEAAVDRAARQRGSRASRSCSTMRRRSTSSPTRPARTTRSRYLPLGGRFDEWHAARRRQTRRSSPDAARALDGQAGRGDGRLPGQAGAEVFDYGNSIRAEAQGWPATRAPSTSRASCPPTSGRCSARARARSAGRRSRGDPEGHRRDRPGGARAVPRERVARAAGSRMAGERVHFQGLPARICWLGYGERDQAGLRVQRAGRHRASSRRPIVIGRDHLDSGSVASPYRETEAMNDGSDAIADWPLLNALVNTASGASWVSIHHGGGVGIGRSIHAGQVTVADGTRACRREARAGAHQRPGHGRHPARRRRLRRGD